MTQILDKTAKLEELESVALAKGAHRAKVFSARQVVVDERVRLKCEIPLCPHFGHCLTCPPNTVSVEDFRTALSKFELALMVQSRSSITGEISAAAKKEVLKYVATAGVSKPKSGDEKVTADLDNMKLAAIRLHKLVNDVESAAMALGFHYATGFIGGDCMLCPECVGVPSGERCRVPYQARPSMEGVGIDVYQTSIHAGLPFEMPPVKEIIWSGLILVD